MVLVHVVLLCHIVFMIVLVHVHIWILSEIKLSYLILYFVLKIYMGERTAGKQNGPGLKSKMATSGHFLQIYDIPIHNARSRFDWIGFIFDI